MAERTHEIKAEQTYLDDAWKLREAHRRQLQSDGPAVAGANSKAQSAIASSSQALLRQFDSEHAPAAFGRLDYDEATRAKKLVDGPVYVGKQLIWSTDSDPVVVPWQSPMAQPFYTARAGDDSGVERKRTFNFKGLKLVDFEDLLLAEIEGKIRSLDNGQVLEPSNGSDALLEDLERARDGRMRDIAKTIQEAQFELISASPDQVLVIQGGPGTGKTAIALHRVSWLLFNHPEISPESTVVVGPNRAFLKYIDQVLPDLGNRSVRMTDMNGLLSGGALTISKKDPPRTAFLKGDLRMMRLLKDGLRLRLRAPEQDLEFRRLGRRGRITTNEISDYLRHASFNSYSQGRDDFRSWMYSRVIQQVKGDQDDARKLIDRDIDRCWPVLNARGFVYDLLSSPERLLQAAGEDFSAQDVLLLRKETASRVGEQVWTDADVPLVDSADFLINGRATSGFAHIVVDEAQDLTPMQIEMLKRKSITGSMTLVGDIAQATGSHAVVDWTPILEQLEGRLPVNLEALKFGYRVPKEVHDFSLPLLRSIAPDLEAPMAVRSVGIAPVLVKAPEDELLAVAARRASEEIRSHESVAVICPDDRASDLAGRLEAVGVGVNRADAESVGPGVTLIPASEVKGLEFESVLVVDSDGIALQEGGGLRLLYIAVTRTTKRLTMVFSKSAIPLDLSPVGFDQDDGTLTSRLDGALDPVVDETVAELEVLLEGLTLAQRVEVVRELTRRISASGDSERLGREDEDFSRLEESDYFDEPNSLSERARKALLERFPTLFDEYPRAYSAWSDDEDEHLSDLVERGFSVREIAEALGRQPGAIRSRLNKFRDI
jgi:DNA helicase IV